MFSIYEFASLVAELFLNRFAYDMGKASKTRFHETLSLTPCILNVNNTTLVKRTRFSKTLNDKLLY